jgi:hypothetical protein
MERDDDALGTVRIDCDASLRLEAGEAVEVQKRVGNVHPVSIAENDTREQCESAGFSGPNR